MLQRVGSAAREVVYPKRCAGCGARGAWVCDLCFDDLALFDPPWCGRCGIPIRLGGCRCAAQPAEIARTRAVGPFAGWLRSAIIAFKYDDEPDRADHLARLLAERIADLAPEALLVATPLHPSRLKQRGYNQSSLLADGVAKVIGRQRADVLARTRATGQQAKLGSAERRANVAGAFALAAGWDAGRLAGRPVLLIDDVFTTGSTAGACADVLLRAGAVAVAVAVLAREA